MTSVSMKCPQCSLSLVDNNHPDVASERDGNGLLMCPNCHVSMNPVGATDVARAESSITEAQRLIDESKPASSMPPAETVETLAKRLHEIEVANNRLALLENTYESKKKSASNAKKDYDDAVISFRSLVRRLTQVSSANTPLFTEEAERNAQAGDAVAFVPREDVSLDLEDPAVREQLSSLQVRLVECGAPCTLEQLAAWTTEEREEAETWARREGTVESMPAHVAEAATAPADEPAAEEPATTTATA